jgi:hypothetical protein
MNNGGSHRVATDGVERKEEKVDNWCRLLGTSSLKEGAV